MSCLYAKTFTHTSTPAVRLIRNRDTTVIIRLNNSLSPGLSKNKPMMPPSLRTLLHRRRLLAALVFPLTAPLKNKLSGENWKKIVALHLYL